MTPIEYVTKLKLQHSKDLLLTTDLTVKVISETLGFFDCDTAITAAAYDIILVFMIYSSKKILRHAVISAVRNTVPRSVVHRTSP